MLDPIYLQILPFDHFTREQVAQLFGVSYHTVPSFKAKGRIGYDGNKYFLEPDSKGRYAKTKVVDFYKRVYGKGESRDRAQIA